LSSECWQGWRQRFERSGYDCIAPAWPHHDRPVAELRRSPDPALASLTIGQVADHYARIVSALPAAPILIGHSLGGLLVQLLLDRGLGMAGVGIGAPPPRGAVRGLSFGCGAFPSLLTLRGWKRAPTLSLRRFSANFAQTLPVAERAALHRRYLVPEARKILFEAALGIGTSVNFGNADRSPLLLVTGEEDRIVRPSVVRAVYRAYLRSPVETAMRIVPRRSHWLLTEPGWEEVADFCIAWAATRSAAL
jgi:pimeloyl-ACP methyl ester carboxylesterase